MEITANEINRQSERIKIQVDNMQRTSRHLNEILYVFERYSKDIFSSNLEPLSRFFDDKTTLIKDIATEYNKLADVMYDYYCKTTKNEYAADNDIRDIIQRLDKLAGSTVDLSFMPLEEL